MISKFTCDVPRLVENTRYIVLNFNLSTVDGRLAHFAVQNSNGDIVADFDQNPVAGEPHTAFGRVVVTDGQAQKVFDLKQAMVTCEDGTPEAGWPGKTIGALLVRGIAQDGKFWIGRTTGVTPDGASLSMEFGVSDAQGLKALSELAAWAQG